MSVLVNIDFSNADRLYIGVFATPTALETAYPTAESGAFASVESTDTLWMYDATTSQWVDTNASGSGTVLSVNGQTGNVVLNTADINATTDKNYVTDAEKTKLSNTSGTNTGDQTAATVPFTPAGGVAATDVQNAIAELDSEKVAKVSSTDNAITRFDGTSGNLQNSSATIDDSGNITASNFSGSSYGTNTGDQTAVTVPFTPAGGVAATDVQNAIAELDSEKVAKVSSTDNAITRFDGTSGNLQNSSVTVDDTANMAGLNEIHFVLSPTASAYSEGTLRWNTTDKTLDIEVGNNSTLQVGQEMYVRVRNSTGSSIANGSLVYVNGSTGNRSTVALAKADAEATAHTLIGMATDDIADNSDGFITVMGTVNDLDTSAFTDGQEIYLSASTVGAFTATAPSAPNYVVKVGSVQRAHATQGRVLIQPQIRTVNASDIRGTVAIGNGGTGLSTLGTALQQLRVNSGATALEYFTPSVSSGGPSIVAEYSTSGVPVAGVAFEKSGRAFTVTSVLASLATLPVGGNFEVNVKKNGTTILSGNLSITTTESASNSLYVVQTGDAGKATVSTTSFSSKDRITIEVVAGSGNTFLGAGLNIQVVGTIS